MWRIKKVFENNGIQYHILRPDGSLVDIELTYGRAWVRMLVYQNLER